MGRGGRLTINLGGGRKSPHDHPKGEFMKIPCWSCGEPRDTLEELCPQCGAGEREILPASTPAEKFDKPQVGEPNKPAEKPEIHIDTKEETTEKFKADPEVKEFLKGVEDDTLADMKADANAEAKKGKKVK